MNSENKPRKPIPVSVVTYRVSKPDPKEIKRLLGRDLIEAERDAALHGKKVK